MIIKQYQLNTKTLRNLRKVLDFIDRNMIGSEQNVHTGLKWFICEYYKEKNIKTDAAFGAASMYLYAV